MNEKELHELEYFDNEGESFDRYTVLVTPPEDRDWRSEFWEGLSLSCNCDSPQGVSMWVDVTPGDHLGTSIKFSDLPENVQEHVRRRLA